jgi:hypothetical protein
MRLRVCAAAAPCAAFQALAMIEPCERLLQLVRLALQLVRVRYL